MKAFKENWPTPAESMFKSDTTKTLPDSNMEYSNIQQLQRQHGLQRDISFLQPSVVYSSPQPDNSKRTLHSTLDTGGVKDIVAPNPNVHIQSETLEEELYVKEQMHPAILSQLKPCKTKDDHNCLYNAICLCLGIPESQQNVLRELTASCLHKHSTHFKDLLKASDEMSLQTLIEQCRQPFCSEGWGNEFHLLALAIMLKRNIVVYTSFKSPKGQFYQRKNKNIVGLAEEFKRGGEKIEQHMNFEPQKGITCDKPICIYLNGSHFTALVPKLETPIYCVPPATNLPSIPDNGIPANMPDSQMDARRMTRKARWLASMTPCQLAEYKARKKDKRKEKKAMHISHNNEDTMVQDTLKSKSINEFKCLQQQHGGKCPKKKRKNTELSSVENESCHKQKKVTKNAATIVSPTSRHNDLPVQARLNSTEDNSVHKKKDTEQTVMCIGKNGSVVSSTHTQKLSKSEMNRRYYEKHKNKIREACLRKYKDPRNHAFELARKKATYAIPEKRMAKLAAQRKSYGVPEKRMAKLAAKRKAYSDPVAHASELAKRKAAYAVPEKRMAKLAAKRKAYSDPVTHASELAKRKAAYAVPGKRLAKLAGLRKFYKNPVNRKIILSKQKIRYENKLKFKHF